MRRCAGCGRRGRDWCGEGDEVEEWGMGYGLKGDGGRGGGARHRNVEVRVLAGELRRGGEREGS